MPFASQAQQRFAFGTGQPWAKRWAAETDFSNLPKKVRKKMKRVKRKAFCMDCVLDSLKAAAPESVGGRPAATAAPKPAAAGGKGQSLGPGITRIRGNLCNVHGRYGPCDAALSKKPKGGKGRKPRAAAKPKGGAGAKPKQTPEQRAAQHQADQEKKRADNRKSVIDAMAAGDVGLSPSGSKALLDFADGGALDPERAKGLAKMGLVEFGSDGQPRLTSAGRAAKGAIDRGDFRGAVDAIGRGTDQAGRNAERDAKRAEAAAKKKPAGGIAGAMSQIGQGKKPEGESAGGGGSKKKPERQQPTHETPEQKREANRASVRDTMAASDTGLAPAGFDNLIGLAGGKEPDAQGAQSLIDMGLAERGGDGTLRLTGPGRVTVNAANRGDAKAAIDAISRGHDQHSAQQQRASDRSKREEERQQREADRKQRQQEQQQRRNSPAQRVRQSRIPIVRGNRGTRRKASDPGDYLVVEDRTKPSTWHLQVKKNGTPDHRLMGAAWAALHGGYRGNKYAGPQKGAALSKLRALYASEKMPIPSEKSFTVFKDANGQMRWLSRTTTAFEDRDEEVISQKALTDSADSTAPRGPLRFWHMGKPNPLDTDRPWGPGVDLGWCDFAAMSGKTLIESGTFKSEAIAHAVAAKADQLELSPGFFHAAGEPDASGVFNHIRIFERSLVPKWAGRASNPYTGLVVEKTMDQKKVEALQTLGVPEATIKELLAEVATTEKAAEADGVRYKDSGGIRDLFVRLLKGEPEQVTTKDEPEEAPPVEETAPPADPLADLLATVKALQEEVAALKAAPTMEIAEGKQGMGDMMPDEETALEDTAEGGVEEPAEEGGLTLSPEDLTAIGQVFGALIEPLVGALGITQKLDAHLGELKSMMSGYTKTKDDADAARADEVASLKAQVAELVGDAPRSAGYRPTQANDNGAAQLLAAIKDGGPGSAALDANPFADLTAQLFPEYAPRR